MIVNRDRQMSCVDAQPVPLHDCRHPRSRLCRPHAGRFHSGFGNNEHPCSGSCPAALRAGNSAGFTEAAHNDGILSERGSPVFATNAIIGNA